jgi:hypothetical protein
MPPTEVIEQPAAEQPRERQERPRGGFQKKVDKLTRRLYLFQQLVAKLEARIRTQDGIIETQVELIKSLQEREAAAWNKTRVRR